MMQLLADRQKVVLVNAKVPRAWESQVNETLADGAKRYKNAVLLDWHDYGGAHPEFFYDDGIHLRPRGRPPTPRSWPGAVAERLRPDHLSAGAVCQAGRPHALVLPFSAHRPRSRSSSAGSPSVPASQH